MGASAPTDSYVSRMVHIVYLENTNLSWSKSNVAPPVIVTTPISLGYSLLNSPSPNGICDVQTSNTYSWNGVSGSWATFNESAGGIYMYAHNTTNFAPTGYYIDVATGIWRYWNATTRMRVHTHIAYCYLRANFGSLGPAKRTSRPASASPSLLSTVSARGS